jgi:hypothetical protein
MQSVQKTKGGLVMRTPTLFLILLLCVVIVSGVSAQNRRMGNAGATELLVPVGARDFAMGGAAIASAEGVEAMYWNPAGLGRIRYGAEAMFSSMAYIADVGVTYGAIAASFGTFGVLGFSVKALEFGDIPLTTNDDPDGRAGRLFSPTYVTVGVTYARGLTEAISAGASFKVVAEQIDRVSASGIAVDVGVLYRNLGGIPGFHLGVAVKNIGPQMGYEGPGLLGPATRADGRRPEQSYVSPSASFELPSSFDIGLTYQSRVTDNLLGTVSGSYTNKNLGLDEFRVGGELAYTMESVRLYGRLGSGFIPQADIDEQKIFGSSIGAGVAYNAGGIDIILDYAYRSAQFFDANSVISVKLGF